MNRFILFLAALLLAAPSLSAQRRELTFNKNGEIKIIQLTDLHLRSTSPEEYAKTFARMDFIVNAEKPDFIAVTGDFIWGKPACGMLKTLLDKLDSFQIPYALVFGNHDAEQELTRAEMSEMIVSGKYNMNALNEKGELADIRIPVGSINKPGTHPFDIYFFDSNDYARNFGFENVGGYAWFTNEQIQWFRNECAASTAANNGIHTPSISFFHIPIPEFYDSWILAQEKKHNGVKGLRGEYGGHPRVNSGMFAAMLETGNMMGVFCGHDHDSDYIISHFGIALVYGRYSGDDTVYNHLAHGTRVIVVKEGERAFRTWIHEDDERILYDVNYKDGILD